MHENREDLSDQGCGRGPFLSERGVKAQRELKEKVLVVGRVVGFEQKSMLSEAETKELL